MLLKQHDFSINSSERVKNFIKNKNGTNGIETKFQNKLKNYKKMLISIDFYTNFIKTWHFHSLLEYSERNKMKLNHYIKRS